MIINNSKSIKLESPCFATVVEVSSVGVKIRIDGEKNERQTFYNSINQVDVGDRVYINYISGTVIILGKLLY